MKAFDDLRIKSKDKNAFYTWFCDQLTMGSGRSLNNIAMPMFWSITKYKKFTPYNEYHKLENYREEMRKVLRLKYTEVFGTR